MHRGQADAEAWQLVLAVGRELQEVEAAAQGEEEAAVVVEGEVVEEDVEGEEELD